MNLGSRVAREAHLTESDPEAAGTMSAPRIGSIVDAEGIERVRPTAPSG